MSDTREIPWRQLVLQADPDHTRESRFMTEYEFSAPSRGDPRTHEGNQRVFKGDYQTRGPYQPEVVDGTGLTWNGTPITWGGQQIDWDSD